MYEPLQICTDCIKENAGIPKSVRLFQKALGGRIISFTRENIIPIEEDVVMHVPYINTFLGRLYGKPNIDNIQQLESCLKLPSILIIHGLYRYHVEWAINYAKKYSIPYWIVLHGSLDPWTLSYRKLQKLIWLKFIGFHAINSASKIITITHKEYQKAKKLIGNKITHSIYLPIDDIYSTSESVIRLKNLRDQFNLKDKRVLLFVGRIHPMKRVIETIENFIKASCLNTVLVILGPESKELSYHDCTKYIPEKFSENIILIGPLFNDYKYDWFNLADGFISLSHRENFNFAAAEALSFALPVILSPGNDLSDDLRNIDVGWLLKSNIGSEEINAIQEFSQTKKESLLKMGLNGKAWADINLSFELFSVTINQMVIETINNYRLS